MTPDLTEVAGKDTTEPCWEKSRPMPLRRLLLSRRNSRPSESSSGAGGIGMVELICLTCCSRSWLSRLDLRLRALDRLKSRREEDWRKDLVRAATTPM